MNTHPTFNSLHKASETQDAFSLLDAVANAISPVYLTESYHEKPLSRKKFIEDLRKQMATKLTHVNRTDSKKRPFFETIPPSGNQGRSLEALQAFYDSKERLGLESVSYVSMLTEYNIYVVEKDKVRKPEGRFEKSIVLIFYPGTGYFVTGAYKNEQGVFETIFGPQDPLLLELNREIRT